MCQHDLSASTVFQGLGFSVSFDHVDLSCLTQAPRLQDVIEGLGGIVLAADPANAAHVTHVVCQHQQQQICAAFPNAVQVSFVWVYQCALSRRRVALEEHALFKPFPATAIDTSSGFEATVTGFTEKLRDGPGEGWSQRSVLFDLIRCSGMHGNRSLNPSTATHLVAESPDCNSDKLNAARQCPRIAIVNVQWLLACMESWRIADTGGHTGYARFDLLGSTEDALAPAAKLGGATQVAASSGAVLSVPVSNAALRTGPRTALQQAARGSESKGLEDMADGLEGLDEEGGVADGGDVTTGSPEHLGAEAAFSMAGGVAQQVGPPSTQLEAAPYHVPAYARNGRKSAAVACGTSAGAHVSTSAALRGSHAGRVSASAAAAAMQPVVEQQDPPDPDPDPGEALSEATWEQEASEVSDGARAPNEELDADVLHEAAARAGAVSNNLAADWRDAAVSRQAITGAALAAGGAGGSSKTEKAAARPRTRKRTDPQRARLHSQLLVASPVHEPPLAPPLDVLPIVTIDAGPAKRRRTMSGSKPRNALQERLEAAAESAGRQIGVGQQVPAAPDETGGAEAPEPFGNLPKMATAAGAAAASAATDASAEAAADPRSEHHQPRLSRAKGCADASEGVDRSTEQHHADRPDHHGSKLAAMDSAAVDPPMMAKDAGAGKGRNQRHSAVRDVGPNVVSKRKAKAAQDDGTAVGSKRTATVAQDGRPRRGGKQAASAAQDAGAAGCRRAATAATATVANSPGRRRTVAVLDPRLGGTNAKATAAKATTAKGSGSKPARRPCFALRGLHTKERNRYEAIVRELGGQVLEHVTVSWAQRVTHLAMPALARSQQVLAGLAVGAWLVSTDYLDACQKAGTWLPEEGYELRDPLRAGKTQLLAADVATHWRLRRWQSKERAFQGLRVLVEGDFDRTTGPGSDKISKLVLAGGGSIVVGGSIMLGASSRADLAVVPGGPQSEKAVMHLSRAGIPCATREYLVEWLAQPMKPLKPYLLSDAGTSLRFAEEERMRGHVTNVE